jgi:phage shock protein PspC (stress-responsive transcriptional regulator)
MTSLGILGLIVLVIVAVLLSRSGVRRVSDGPIAGVCGGLARHFGTTELLMRVVAVIALLCTGGTAIVIYIILWAALPKV